MVNEQEALNIHKEAIVIDMLFTLEDPPGDDIGFGFDKMRLGGVTAINASILGDDFSNFYAVMERVASWYPVFERYSDTILLVTTSEDIETAKEQNKIGIFLGFQSSRPIENNIDFLNLYHRLGVRIMQLTYQNSCRVGGGGGDEPTDYGLSKFGIRVIKRMNELGVLIDVSHCGDRTVMEAIEISEKPIAFTHANPRSLCNVQRNKTDEQIKALAEKGGLIGICMYSPLLKNGPNSVLDDYVDAIDYVANLVGIDHVGIGTDALSFRGLKAESEIWFESKQNPVSWKARNPKIAHNYTIETLHVGTGDLSCLPQITVKLAERGYSSEDIKKFLGENSMRLFRQVW